jgi:hypothetical protein
MELQQQQHCRFGLGLDRLLISLVGIFNFASFNYHLHRAKNSNEYPNFGNADR